MKRLMGLAAVVALSLTLLGASACSQALKGSLSSGGEKQEQEKKKKKSEKKGREPSRAKSTRQVLSRILRDYKQGLELLSPSKAAKEIDRELFYNYPRFEEELTTFLRSLGELRLFVREVNVQVEDDRAVMIVDAEMKITPRDDADERQERKQQITFDFRRTPSGWKITEINPRAFFLP